MQAKPFDSKKISVASCFPMNFSKNPEIGNVKWEVVVKWIFKNHWYLNLKQVNSIRLSQSVVIYFINYSFVSENKVFFITQKNKSKKARRDKLWTLHFSTPAWKRQMRKVNNTFSPTAKFFDIGSCRSFHLVIC